MKKKSSPPLEDVLETLLDEPFMAITSGPPDYSLEKKDGPEGYHQVLVSLFLENVRPDVIAAFNENYNSLADKFDAWAKGKGFVSSQILGGDDESLVFEITAIA